MDSVFGLSVDHQIITSDALRAVADMPSHHVTDKVIDHIDDLAKRFIEASSLAVLSSSRLDGIQDVPVVTLFTHFNHLIAGACFYLFWGLLELVVL